MEAAQSVAGRRRLSQAELDMIVTAHEKFVTGKQGGKRASLRFMQLSGLDLSFRNLIDADLSASILEGCRMVRTKLDRASLFGCDLRKVDMRQASLVRADLRGACLRGANLAQADLTQADFREGQIAIPHPRKGLETMRHETRQGEADEVNFSGATLDGSRFEGVSAFKADFSDCSLRGAKLSGANLKEANLVGAILDGADVKGANLEGANLTGAVMAGVDTSTARVSGAHMTGALRGSTREAVAKAEELYNRCIDNQRWCQTGGKEGQAARLDGEDLRPLGGKLKGLRLTAMSAKGACMVGLDLSGVQLQGANLQNADLRMANLRGADLRGAKLTGANLTKADLRQAFFAPLPLGPDRSTPTNMASARLRYVMGQVCDLSEAVLDGADLRGADFTGARTAKTSFRNVDLSQVQGLDLSAPG